MTGVKNAGGRTGMGAVMGSKNLKAVAARGTMDIKIAYPQEALDYNKRFVTQVTSAKVNETQGRLGTPFLFGATNTQGLVRVQNFRLNQLENSDAVEAEAIDEFVTGMAGCYGCQVHCRAKYVIPTGPYAGTYGEGPEYTHQCAFSAEPGCRDPITILEGTHLSNIYGIDCLEAGSMIAWAMELYENGILTDKDTGGLELRFGNTEAVIEMMHRITNREGLGDILAEGPLRAASIIGKGSEKYLVQVKGMSNLNSDERATPSLALNIATASRGSDHLRSRPAIDLYHLPEKVLRQIYSQPVKYDGPLSSDFRSYEGKAWQVHWQEQTYMGVDSVGICKYHTTFLSATSPNWEEWSRAIYLNTGLEMSPMDLWDAADRANELERMFNLREGLTKKDDWLVDRYFDEPNPLGTPNIRGKVIDREKFRKAIDEFYQHHGWDENGVPRPEKLKKLGLDKEPSHQL
jgi:aldehyde:ferredoxin oxidoreductase